jgi:hypothetical protein
LELNQNGGRFDSQNIEYTSDTEFIKELFRGTQHQTRKLVAQLMSSTSDEAVQP